jgi:F-type H+-transporting ATPase subunit gamma
MPTLRDIQRRISSVKSTQQITRAMKLVAAAKLRRAQDRIEHARPYARTMAEVLADLTKQTGATPHPLLESHQAEGQARKLLVVVSADRGLCGAFNSNIIRRSLELLRGYRTEEVALALVVVGRKARDFYRRRGGVEVKSEHVNMLERLGYAQAAGIAQELMRPYVEGEVDEVVLVYTEFRSVASQRVVVERLLPIQPPAAAGEAESEEYLFEPSPEAVLERLLPRHVEVQVYRALLESVAAEYGARMTAMESATRNAAEMIDVLTIQFNKARQERITTELLEIVGGAEALRQASE